MASLPQTVTRSPQFSSLPVELQIEIFKIHLHTPRIVEIYYSEKIVIASNSDGITDSLLRTDYPSTAIPALFHVNTMSRNLAFDAFGFPKKTNDDGSVKFRRLGPRPIINFEIDTLFFSQWYFLKFLRSGAVYDYQKEVQSVAFASHIWHAVPGCANPTSRATDVVQAAYPKLKELVSLEVPRLDTTYPYRRRHRIWYREFCEAKEAEAIRTRASEMVLEEFQNPFLDVLKAKAPDAALEYGPTWGETYLFQAMHICRDTIRCIPRGLHDWANVTIRILSRWNDRSDHDLVMVRGTADVRNWNGGTMLFTKERVVYEDYMRHLHRKLMQEVSDRFEEQFQLRRVALGIPDLPEGNAMTSSGVGV